MNTPALTTSHSPSCGACSPSSIYLQVFGDSEDIQTPIPAESWGEVTWSKERVFAGDARYVRWDLMERLLQTIDELKAEKAAIFAQLVSLQAGSRRATLDEIAESVREKYEPEHEGEGMEND